MSFSTIGAGSLLDDTTSTKRHSRSLDLQANARIGIVRHLHQRSASESDGLELISAAEEPLPSPTASPQSIFSFNKKSSPKTKMSARASIGSAFANFRQPSFTSSKKSNHRYSCATMNNKTDVMDTITKYNTITEEKVTSTSHNLPVSLLDQRGESKRSLPSSLQQEINQFAIDGFAMKYFATHHKRGLFFRRRAVPMNELLRWTKDSIKQPLLLSSNKKEDKKDALKCFKIIQMLMHDRPKSRLFLNEKEAFQSLLGCGISKGQMRDEIYVQICRQLNKNPRGASIRKGWEILCVISVTFPPSKDLESYLQQFVEQHHDIKENGVDVLSEYVSNKLTRICTRGARGKVLSAAEIERAIEAPFRPSVFGEPLESIMKLQQEETPHLKIPKIVTFLTNAVHDLNGQTSEGIFRVPGDADAVTELRIRIENGHYDASGIEDPNVPASLLKYWLRDLSEPIIPTHLYNDCIQHAHDKQKAIETINSLPEINRHIVLYMIRFLQDFADPNVIQHTLMNVFNLAMVFAPNFLRCPSVNLTTIFENSKYEQIFLKTLITEIQVDEEALCIQ